MLKLKGRLITTHLTRDNIRFSKEALESCVKQINDSDKIMPFNVNHDSARQIGFVVPGSAKIIQLEDGEFAVEAEVNVYENTEEKLNHFVDIRQKSEIVELEKIGKCTKIDDTNCPTYWLDKSLFEILKITPQLNKDKLLVLNDAKNLCQKGIIVNKDYIVKFHNFLRRSYTEPNSFNKRLIDKIKELKIKNPTLKIAFLVTPNAISFNNEFKESFEFDYAWGPKFPKNLNQLKEGVTQHISSDKDKSMENLDKTEFWWHKDDDTLMSLEIEEIRDKQRYLTHPENKDKYFPLKYGHLQYNKDSGKIIHLDCALRIYPEQTFDTRVTTNDISKVSKKHSDRVKLFRIDGDLDKKDAFDIFSFFFYNNSDVREYLNVEAER